MKKWNREKGREGERRAAEYLEKKGFLVVDRNWRKRWGEIDLVVEKDGVLVFVEVKMKTGGGWGRPEDMVDERKLGQVGRLSRMYVTEKSLWDRYKSFRIDVVCIEKMDSDSGYRVRWYENVGYYGG